MKNKFNPRGNKEKIRPYWCLVGRACVRVRRYPVRILRTVLCSPLSYSSSFTFALEHSSFQPFGSKVRPHLRPYKPRPVIVGNVVHQHEFGLWRHNVDKTLIFKIMYYNGEICSCWGSMRPKIRITSKKISNKSCSKSNFAQKCLRAHMSISPTSGARGPGRSVRLKSKNVQKREIRFTLGLNAAKNTCFTKKKSLE